MGKIIRTPLAVVYVNEDQSLSVGENLDLCRISDVWGVCYYEELSDFNLFISKKNGPDLTIGQADKWAYDKFVGYFFDEHDTVLYAGLPHYEEFLSLFFGYFEKINKMMKIFRKYGIGADDFYDDFYLVYSNEAFAGPHDLHLRRIIPHCEINEPFSYKAMRTDDGASTVLSFTKETAPKEQRFHTRLFLHQFN